jgi:hypothetical protein
MALYVLAVDFPDDHSGIEAAQEVAQSESRKDL